MMLPEARHPCTTHKEQLQAEKGEGAVTWWDEQRDAHILEHQAATTVIHLSSREHQQLVHQLTDDGLALSGCVQFLVEGGHLWQCGRCTLP